MRTFKYSKLVRDKLIENFEKKGSIFNIKKLDDEEFNKELKIKLQEEANEVLEAKTRENLIEELADIFEVVESICDVNDITFENIMDIKKKKVEGRGGFNGRNFVISATHPKDSYSETYCLNNSDKYPEIK